MMSTISAQAESSFRVKVSQDLNLNTHMNSTKYVLNVGKIFVKIVVKNTVDNTIYNEKKVVFRSQL